MSRRALIILLTAVFIAVGGIWAIQSSHSGLNPAGPRVTTERTDASVEIAKGKADPGASRPQPPRPPPAAPDAPGSPTEKLAPGRQGSQAQTAQGCLLERDASGRNRLQHCAAEGPFAEGEEGARAFLRQHAVELGLESDLADLDTVEVKHGLVSTRTLFSQSLEGLPVHDAHISVNQGPGGTVNAVHSDYRPLVPAGPARPSLTSAEAEQIARTQAQVSSLRQPSVEELVWVRAPGDEARLAWRLTVFSEEPLGDFFTLIDDQSRKVMLQENRILFYVVGSGLVYQPNPIQSSGNTSLSDNNDNTSTALDAERVRVDLLGLDEGYDTLRGEFVDLVSLPGGLNVADAVNPSRTYDYNRDQNQFEQVNIYSTVDSLVRYIESLGFNDDVGVPNGIRDRPTLAHAHWNLQDNSFYSTGDDAIHFGRGGVDDGEDADIIVHEFGHAIHFDQNACWSGGETGAMGEGFGDYLAASFFADVGDSAHQSAHAACVGEWDAASYSSSEPPCLRRVDRNKIYPDDLSGSVHADGEIWSRSLWDIRESLGGPAADRIILEHHFLVPCNATMNDAANQLLQADLDLNAGANRNVIIKAFCDRGILTGSICDPPLALRLAQSLIPDPPQPEKVVTLTVTATNESSELLEGIVLSADIPAGTEYVSGSASNSGVVEARQISWQAFDLRAAESAQRSFAVRLDSGPGSETVLADDMEATSSAWTVAHQQGSLDWTLSSSAPRSGLQHWLASEPAEVSDQTLTTAEPFLMTAGMTFVFWHSFDTENRYDGGVIEISTDGGSTWNDLAPQILTNGYRDTISPDYNSPIAGRSAFTGNSEGYIETRVDLDAFAGETGLTRFRMTSDSSVGGSGWSIDDVTISRVVSLESTFRASGAATATSTSTVQVQPPPPNNAPEITINAGLTVEQGEASSITPTVLQATDDDPEDTLTYTVTSGPSEGQLVPASGFTQDQIDAGSVTYQHNGGESLSDAFTFEVDDGRGGSTEAATFTMTITPSNAQPSLALDSIADAVANELYVLTVTPTDTDPEDTLTLYLDSGPRWLNAPVDEGDGRWRLSGIPSPGNEGTTSLTLRVSDNGSPVREISQTFDLIVQPQLNAVPTLSEWGQIGIAAILLALSLGVLQSHRFNPNETSRPNQS